MTSEMCINRNIVECKGMTVAQLKQLASGINRNIVECKDEYARRMYYRSRVLIETLWNVKISMANGWNYVKQY